MNLLAKALLILFFLTSAFAAESEESVINENRNNRNVLVMFSQAPTTPAYKEILEGIREKLDEAFDGKYNLHTEYLNKIPYYKDSDNDGGFSKYNEKYRKIRLDLLICVGLNIIPLIKTYADSNIRNLPCVSVDFDFSGYGIKNIQTLNKRTTNINVKVDASRSLFCALKVFPETKHFYIVTGSAPIDSIMGLITKIDIKHLGIKDRTFTFFENTQMDEVLGKVKNLPEKSVVFITSFNSDNKNVPYYNNEVASIISRATRFPVFSLTDMGIGEGAVGGEAINFRKTGRITGGAAVTYLKGNNTSWPCIITEDPYQILFDWKVLKKFGLETSPLLPRNSTFINQEISIFGRYRYVIISGILFLIFQFLLIINLIRISRKQKHITAQLRSTEMKYRELAREDRILRIGQLTASLSHELNQPLTAILCTAQAGIRFIDSGKNDPEQMKEILGNIVEDNRRTASILSSLRGMMMLEKREKEKTNMQELLEEVVQIYRSEALSKNVNIFLELPDITVYTICDRTQIQQVLLNFMSNSIGAMSSVPFEKRIIYLSLKVNDEKIVISVKDNGTGIDEKIKATLFKPFVTSKPGGTGIGLSISKSIIEDHKGTISAVNLPEGGAKFSFEISRCND